MKICLSLTLLLVVCVSGACRRHEQRYELKGKVVMVEKEKHLVTIAHEDVKGLMPAMTMPFTVPSKADLDFVAPEDQLTATLVVDGSQSWLENLFVVRTTGTPSAAMNVAEANKGDELPSKKPRRKTDSPSRLSRQSAAAHVHLHALPVTRILHLDEQQLRADRSPITTVARPVCEDTPAQRQHRSKLRLATGAA
jgi:Cu/Ag efflux protein CusF